MKRLIISCAIVLTILSLITSVLGCIQKTNDFIETIYIFKAESPDDPPPPGGWTFASTGPHPTEIQRVFDSGDKMFLGLVISDQIQNEINLSRFTFFNKGTGTKEEVATSPSDLGPFEPGGKYLSGFQNPWGVPSGPGEYELRIYLVDEVIASALFSVTAVVLTKTEEKITARGVHINWGKDISFRGSSVLPDGTHLQTQLYEYEDGEQPVAWWPAEKYIQVQDEEWQITVPLSDLDEGTTKLYIGSETVFLFKVWEKDNPSVMAKYGFELTGPPPAQSLQ